MTCVPSDRILQTLRVTVPGAPDPMLELALFNVIDEFLRRTSAWVYQTQIVMQDGVDEYPVPTPGNAVIVRTLGVSYNGQPVVPVSSSVSQSSTGTLIPKDIRPDGDALFTPFSSDINASTGLFSYSLFRPNYISINNQPTGNDRQYPLVLNLVLSVAKQCLECDCGDWDIPEWMWDMYFDVWEDGTVARLFAMPAKPWSNLVLAQYHSKRFRNKMAFRKQEIARGFVYNSPAWRFPQSGWP